MASSIREIIFCPRKDHAYELISELDDVAIRLWTRIVQGFASNFGHDIKYSEFFSGFPRSYQVNVATVPELRHGRSFQIISNPLFLYNLTGQRSNLGNRNVMK
jgi:hypothetical protein